MVKKIIRDVYEIVGFSTICFGIAMAIPIYLHTKKYGSTTITMRFGKLKK